MNLRARTKITSHFRISSSGHLRTIFTYTILNVGLPTLPVLQIDPICPKSEREFSEVIFLHEPSRRKLGAEKLCKSLMCRGN